MPSAQLHMNERQPPCVGVRLPTPTGQPAAGAALRGKQLPPTTVRRTTIDEHWPSRRLSLVALFGMMELSLFIAMPTPRMAAVAMVRPRSPVFIATTIDGQGPIRALNTAPVPASGDHQVLHLF